MFLKNYSTLPDYYTAICRLLYYRMGLVAGYVSHFATFLEWKRIAFTRFRLSSHGLRIELDAGAAFLGNRDCTIAGQTMIKKRVTVLHSNTNCPTEV